MDFDNLDNLIKYIQSNVNETLQNEVADTVKEIMSNEVGDVVYNAYKPSIYKRRGLDGGLADTNNMAGELVSEGVLEVWNDTPLNNAYGYNDNGMTLSEIIVSGDGYMYESDSAYTRPRDFIFATKQSLEQNGQHIEALRRGLKKRGIDME